LAEALAVAGVLERVHVFRVMRGYGREDPTAGLDTLFRGPLPRLRVLDFESSYLGDAVARCVAAAPALAGLTELNLAFNGLGDDAATALAAAPHLAGLTVLNLWHNGITERGARALADSPHLTCLRRLMLWDNPVGFVAKGFLRERFGEVVRLSKD
jgi:hypothetical protein